MKKVFVSMPMRGKGKEEIFAERERLLSLAASSLGEKVELVESYLGEGDYKPLERLGESLKRMANADLVIFSHDWEDARGCCIERTCALEYGVTVWDIEPSERPKALCE